MIETIQKVAKIELCCRKLRKVGIFDIFVVKFEDFYLTFFPNRVSETLLL